MDAAGAREIIFYKWLKETVFLTRRRNQFFCVHNFVLTFEGV